MGSIVMSPILPIPQVHSREDLCPGCVEEILHAQHHSLTVPRDFDVSPYFEIVKPSLASGLDPTDLVWTSDTVDERPRNERPPGADARTS